MGNTDSVISATAALRIVNNVLKDKKGEEVAIKEGAPVNVTIEADEKDTIKNEEK